MPLHLPGARHPYILVEPRRRWLAIRREDGRLDDLGFVDCYHLMPHLGSIGGEVTRLACPIEEMRPGYLFRYDGEDRGEWCVLPESVESDAHGHPLRIVDIDAEGNEETWSFDELAREQVYGAKTEGGDVPELKPRVSYVEETREDKRGGYWSTLKSEGESVIYLGFGLTKEKAQTAATILLPSRK